MLGFIRAGRAGLSRAAGQNLANVRPVVSIRTQAAAVETKPYFSLEVVDGVAVVRMDQPGSSMNTISVAMQDEFAGVLDEIENNPNINSAVLISAKPGCFVAGADIQMINNVTTAAEGEALSKGGQDMFKRIENSKKKFVAAINGPALGGGLELAMACHYRVATTSKITKLGLPEVMLGVLPGAGGTQRLVQLVGPAEAFPMLMTGATKVPKKAKSMGLVDQTVEPLGPGKISTVEYLEKVAVDYAKQLAAGSIKRKQKKLKGPNKIAKTLISNGLTRDWFFQKNLVDNVMKKTKGVYPAPLTIAELLKESSQVGFGTDAAYAAEAKKFGELSVDPVTKSMINIFNAKNHCTKNRWGKPEKSVEEIAVLGAGLMGAGIAQVSIDKGYTVVLKDASGDFLDAGAKGIHGALNKKVKKKRLSKWDSEIIYENLKPTLNYEDMAKSGLIIEAVPEVLDLKHRIIREIVPIAPKDHIFATNTSGLLVKDIAQAHPHPENVIGMHYFSPVPQMELLEIIPTAETSEETLRAACEVGLKQKKTIIVVKDVPGFYCNRCLAPALKEVLRLFQEGVDPAKINELSTKAGFAVGTSTLIDEVGVDIAHHAAVNIGCSPLYGSRMDGGNPDLLQKLINEGNLGKKTKKGVFDYSNKKGPRTVTPEFTKIAQEMSMSNAHGMTSDDDLVDRILLRYTNEAALCLQEEVIQSPQEGDIGAIFGTGYPPNKGGPFMYMDTVGAKDLITRMERLADKIGPEFTPSQILYDMEKSGKKFY